MQPDTRKLLTVGSALFLAGALAAVLMLYVFGGVGQHGPHTNSGWLALMAAMACLPLGSLTLLLAFAKLAGDRNR